jgi:hypothetical protein
VRRVASLSSELGSREDNEDANLSKPRPENLAPAELCLDAAGESDFEYFRCRPFARTRIRAPFPGEFSRRILKRGRGRQAVIIVAIDRDAAGEPERRARGVVFVDGGHA